MSNNVPAFALSTTCISALLESGHVLDLCLDDQPDLPAVQHPVQLCFSWGRQPPYPDQEMGMLKTTELCLRSAQILFKLPNSGHCLWGHREPQQLCLGWAALLGLWLNSHKSEHSSSWCSNVSPYCNISLHACLSKLNQNKWEIESQLALSPRALPFSLPSVQYTLAVMFLIVISECTAFECTSLPSCFSHL